MWILPRNHQLYSAYVQDTVDSKSVLKECLEKSMSSLMWRSNPSPLRTWLIRWKRVKWLRHLSGLMLKPSMQKSFEDSLTSLLEDTLASRFLTQADEKGKKTHDISGRTSPKLLKTANQNGYFSKMLKDTLVMGSYKSSGIWNGWVTNLKLEYFQRLKLAHRIREKESLSLDKDSWSTPIAGDWKGQRRANDQPASMLSGQIQDKKY